MIEVHRYPTHVFYGTDGTKYACYSFMGQKKGSSDLHLYRKVNRVFDGAFQFLRGMQTSGELLYFDRKCTFPADVYISPEKWTLLSRPNELF